MKAIVCDKCGHVTLLEDYPFSTKAKGVYTLYGEGDKGIDLDLCEKCAAELVDAVREAGVRRGSDG